MQTLMLCISIFLHFDKLDQCVLPVAVMLVNSAYVCELSRAAGSGADGLSEDSGRTYRLFFFFFFFFCRPPSSPVPGLSHSL